MRQTVSLAEEIKKQLPTRLTDFMRRAGEIASRKGERLYLVGGVVRDLLLHRPNFDLDLVVDGDAISLARELADAAQVKLTTHSRFNTAKIRFNEWNVDFATARSETYERPGALPKVMRGTIAADLYRRDFTVNAMAVEVTAGSYGELIDIFGGVSDLKGKLVRILHEKSFIDDATRMWRAVRYEQRLGFLIEPSTERILERSIPMLDTISGDRIRHELELVLKERRPEKALTRAWELGILAKLHPSLKADTWLASKFRRARAPSTGGNRTEVCLALLCYRLTEEEAAQLITYLNPTRRVAEVIANTLQLKSRLDELAAARLTRSYIYSLLHEYPEIAITVNRISTENSMVAKRLNLYLRNLRHIRPSLSGDNLIETGIPAGPRIKEILHMLLEARLDGKIKTREEEMRLAKDWGRQERV